MMGISEIFYSHHSFISIQSALYIKQYYFLFDTSFLLCILGTFRVWDNPEYLAFVVFTSVISIALSLGFSKLCKTLILAFNFCCAFRKKFIFKQCQ